MNSTLLYVNEYQKVIPLILYDYGIDVNNKKIDNIIKNVNIDILKCVNFIIKTQHHNKMLINAYRSNISEEFVTNISSYELLNLESCDVKKEMVSCLKKTKIPAPLYASTTIPNIGTCENVFTSKTDDVFFYDSLVLKDSLCRDILFPDVMCSLNIRLHIPIYILNEIEKHKCNIIYKKILLNNNIICEETFDRGLIVQKTNIDNDIYHSYKDYRCLPLNTIYEVVINCTLSELQAIVKDVYKLEKGSTKPTVCYMYYYLSQYYSIYQAIKFKNDVELFNILWGN